MNEGTQKKPQKMSEYIKGYFFKKKILGFYRI